MTAPSHSKDWKPRSEPVRIGTPLDILWGRPIFRAPPLPNPRVIFDPLPFRALIPPSTRTVRSGVFGHLNAA